MMTRVLFIIASLMFISACQSPVPVQEFVKGSFTDIQQQNEGSAYVVLFWSEECAYCMKELELFGQLDEKASSKFKLITISTDPLMDKDKVRAHLAEFNLAKVEAWVFAEAYPETLYFDVDRRWRGELPLSFLFDKQSNKTKKMGMLKPDDLMVWLTKNKPHQSLIN